MNRGLLCPEAGHALCPGELVSSRRGFLKRPLAGLGNPGCADVLMREGRSAQSVSRWGTDVRFEGEEMEHILRGKGSLDLPLGNREPPDPWTGTWRDLAWFQAGSRGRGGI